MNGTTELVNEASVREILEDFKKYNDRNNNKEIVVKQELARIRRSVGRFGKTIDHSVKWLDKFQELYEYKEKYGDFNVPTGPKKHDDDNHCLGQLGRWVQRHRNLYMHKLMTKERFELLKSIGFDQCLHKSTNTSIGNTTKTAPTSAVCPEKEDCKVRFDEQLAGEESCTKSRRDTTSKGRDELGKSPIIPTNHDTNHDGSDGTIRTVDHPEQDDSEIKQCNGHLIVEDSLPQTFEKSVHQLLEDFKQFKHKNRENLPPNHEKKSRILFERLVASADCFGKTFHHSVKWLNKLEELYEYKKRYGNCNVPENSKNQKLARWVRLQRDDYANKQTRMSEKRIQMLNALDFNWLVETKTKKWHDKFEELQQYKSKHGHCNVPCSKNVDSPTYQLGKWVSYQRKQYKLMLEGLPNHLTQDRIELLKSLGFDCNLQTSTRKRLDIAKGKESKGRNNTNNQIISQKQETKKKRLENEQKDNYCEQYEEQITVEAQEEDPTKAKIEKTHSRNLKDKIQVLCKLSIMFQNEKNAMYSSFRKRKIDNNSILNDSKRYRK